MHAASLPKVVYQAGMTGLARDTPPRAGKVPVSACLMPQAAPARSHTHTGIPGWRGWMDAVCARFVAAGRPALALACNDQESLTITNNA